MLRGTAGRRYAESVFSIAKEANSYDRWLSDLATIESVFTQPVMARFLADPKPDVSQKQNAARQILSNRVDALALNLALLLVARDHAGSVPALRREFVRMVNDARNIAVAQVRTAIQLDAKQTDDLKQRLERLTSKTIQLDLQVDKSILGGFVARVGDVLIDASVSSRLETMRQQLLSGQA